MVFDSLQKKISAIVILILFVSMGLLAGITYWKARGLLFSSMEESLGAAAVHSAERIALWVEEHQREVEKLAVSKVILSGKQAEIQELMQMIKKSDTGYEDVVYVRVNGDFYTADGKTGSLSDRDYFKQALQGKVTVSDPLTSKMTGKTIVSIAAPVKQNNAVVAVMVVVMDLAEISEWVNAIKVGETGYAFAVQQDGLLIMHPNASSVLKTNLLSAGSDESLQQVVKAMVGGNAGGGHYEFQGVDKLIAYAPIPGVSWFLGITVPTREVSGKLTELTWITGILTLLVLLAATAIVMMFSRSLSQPIQTMAHYARQIAEGDVKVYAVTLTARDEVGSLNDSFKMMSSNLRTLIQKLIAATERVAAASEELTVSADQSSIAANQITNSITNIAESAERQSMLLADGQQNITRMIDEVQAMTQTIADVSSISVEAGQSADVGGQTIDKAIAQMKIIEQKTADTTAAISTLAAKSAQIGQFVETISKIAGQTNLLALNAAIEAARAGEQGRGFSVVAEEVRTLAEQSDEAAKQIAVLIQDVQRETNHAVATMRDSNAEVHSGTEVVGAAGQSFTQIVHIINKIAAGLDELAAQSHSVAADSSVVIQSVDFVNEESTTMVGQTQMVSAATEEQAASMEEVASASRSLADLAEELRQVTITFKL